MLGEGGSNQTGRETVCHPGRRVRTEWLQTHPQEGSGRNDAFGIHVVISKELNTICIGSAVRLPFRRRIRRQQREFECLPAPTMPVAFMTTKNVAESSDIQLNDGLLAIVRSEASRKLISMIHRVAPHPTA